MSDHSAIPASQNLSGPEIIAKEPMGRLQIIAVIMCVLLTALDGFDVLSISFASPGIAKDWGIGRAALGIVLSMELIGMAVGSVILGTVADRIGRRPTALICLTLMFSGMLMAAYATSVTTMSAFRFFTGLGIGGMLAAINAMVAEHSNGRSRNFAVICMATGFPLGAIIGGSIVSVLLQSYDWRSVFFFGSAVTALFIPLVWFFLPETVSYLDQKRPQGALEKINRTLRRMGHSTAVALGPVKPKPAKTGLIQLFSPELIRVTVVLTGAYFLHILTFYFMIKWIPKIVVDMGFAASTAGGVLVWTNVGSLIGALLLAFLSSRYTVRALVIIVLLCSTVMVTIFGRGYTSLESLTMVAATVGFFTNAGVVGLYALFAESFPTEVRASGTGFAIGVGRGGSAVGPILAGYLFSIGQGLQAVALLMAMGSLFAVVFLLFLYKKKTVES